MAKIVPLRAKQTGADRRDGADRTARFVGGPLQAEFMARIKGLDPDRCLVVPVDIG